MADEPVYPCAADLHHWIFFHIIYNGETLGEATAGVNKICKHCKKTEMHLVILEEQEHALN